MTLIDQDAKALLDGYPAFVGHDEVRTLVELFTERASHMKVDYKAVEPMDTDAKFVYSTLHFEFFNESGDKYIDAT